MLKNVIKVCCSGSGAGVFIVNPDVTISLVEVLTTVEKPKVL